jgi:hypothetical protein
MLLSGPRGAKSGHESRKGSGRRGLEDGLLPGFPPKAHKCVPTRLTSGSGKAHGPVAPGRTHARLTMKTAPRCFDPQCEPWAILGLPVDTGLRSPGASAVVYGGGAGRGIVFGEVADARSVPGADLRCFGKPESFAKRRMGVALARADDVDTARRNATRAASRVRPRAAGAAWRPQCGRGRQHTFRRRSGPGATGAPSRSDPSPARPTRTSIGRPGLRQTGANR